MVLLRWIGNLLLLAAAIALIYDLTPWLQGRPLAFASLAADWKAVAPAWYQAAQEGLQHVHPALWNPMLLGVLRIPAWIGLGVAGGALFLLGLPRRRVNIFAN